MNQIGKKISVCFAITLISLSFYHLLCPQKAFGEAAGKKLTMVESTLFVDGLTCISCATKVRTVVTKLPGIQKVRIITKKQSVTVFYNPEKISLSQIISTINTAGFKADIL